MASTVQCDQAAGGQPQARLRIQAIANLWPIHPSGFICLALATHSGQSSYHCHDRESGRLIIGEKGEREREERLRRPRRLRHMSVSVSGRAINTPFIWNTRRLAFPFPIFPFPTTSLLACCVLRVFEHDLVCVQLRCRTKAPKNQNPGLVF